MREEPVRKCTKCGKVKLLDSDHFHQLRVKVPYSPIDWIGYYYRCKECRNAEKRGYNKKNKDKISEYNKAYYAEHGKSNRKELTKDEQRKRESYNRQYVRRRKNAISKNKD